MKTAPSPVHIPTEYVKRINMNGLSGRFLHLPALKKRGPKSKPILFVHGQHASLERCYSISQFLNDYGEVYQPDLPGFGGMKSFYSIGRTPDYDAYADYLYTFMRGQNLTKDVTFFSLSFGSQVMTRMFQKYPETAGWTKQAVSLVGFGAGSNFHLPSWYRWPTHLLAHIASNRLGVAVINILFFNRLSLNLMLILFSRLKSKMQSDDANLKRDMVRMESHLWRINDHRTHGKTALMMFNGDLRKYSDDKIPLTLHNVMTKHDQYFDHAAVKNTFLELYEDYKEYDLDLEIHAPSLIADKRDVDNMVPEAAKKLLAG